jgi:hypothetical protein
MRSSLDNGAPIKSETLWTMMKRLKSRITRIIESWEKSDETEKEKLRVLPIK